MSGEPAIPATDDLHAYADGRLDPERSAAVDAWLMTRPDEAARIADYGRINAELHRLYDPVLAEPVPEAWRRRPGRWRQVTPRQAAIAAGWLVLGLVGGWVLRDAMVQPPAAPPIAAAGPSLPAQAINAHSVYVVEVRHPVEVAASEEEHLVAWLSKRMGRTIKAPRLESAGYRLVGGRLLPAADGGAAAQFMYEEADGNRITLYVKTAAHGPSETAFRFIERDGISVFYWLDGPLGYALAGKCEREELLQLARLIYEQLNP